MKRKHIILALMLSTTALTTVLVGCKKDQGDMNASSASGTQQVSLYLTDGPGLFESVNLDIKSVEVLVDTSGNTRHHDNCDWDHIGHHGIKPDSSLVWTDLGVAAGKYDVLTLRNGVDTLLAQSTIPFGAVRLIRINLGTGSTVTVEGVTYPLQIPTGADAFILIKLRGDEFEEHAHRHFRLWLDFDIQRSIIRVNSSTFILRPVMGFFVPDKTGRIDGVVLPMDAKALVQVTNGTDTLHAIPGRGGKFSIRGLADGTYSMYIHSYNGYADTTISNIAIVNASKVNEGAIVLHK